MQYLLIPEHHEDGAWHVHGLLSGLPGGVLRGVELDEELGRKRCQRAEASETAPNYRNRCSRKTVKTQLGEVEIKEL